MDLSHVIIVRGVGEKGQSVQMKVAYDGEPPEGAEDALLRHVAVGFEETFHAPARFGVGTFPFIEEEDGDDG